METVWKKGSTHLAAIVLVFSLALNGCTPLLLPDYEVQPVHEYDNRKTISDLTIAIHPLTDADESMKYFGIDFNNTELLPILIVIDNKNKDLSYVIRKEKLKLFSGKVNLKQNGNNLKAVSELKNSGENLGVASMVLVSLPLALAAANIEYNSLEIKRNMLENEFQTTSVSPGTKSYGFIYFSRPQGDEQIKNFELSVDADNLKLQSTDSFNFNFSI